MSDAAEIRRALAVLFRPDQVVELRALHVDGRRKNTASGYFADHDALAKAAVRLDGRSGGVYVTLNEINPALLARRVNRVEEWADLTTADHDVIRRRWLPVDFDAARPAGISSSDSEHDAAIDRARAYRAHLEGQGLGSGVLADSGNGAHLLYPVDLPNDQESLELVKGVLAAAAEKFSDDVVAVDQTTCNAARIWKLYGTTARKGDSTPGRPHRLSRILEAT